MEIINKKVTDLKPYEKNPRKNDEAVKYVAESIKQFGFKVPIIIDKNNTIVCGHTRYKASKKLGLDEVPCILADDLTDEQIKAFRLADNKVSERSEWDFDLLDDELKEIVDIDMAGLGFKSEEEEEADRLNNLSKKYNDATSGILAKKFIFPPYSILDARQGKWQERKKAWRTFVDSQKGRDTRLLSAGLEKLGEEMGSDILTGTSVFDPVLCEILINWYSPQGGKILDPFAGGSVRGIVSAALDRKYYGNDLRQEQIDENKEQGKIIEGQKTVYGTPIQMPVWTCGDSKNIDEIIKERDFDFLLTCPPYADLEQYSDLKEDISNMDYDEFLKVYTEILQKSISMLKDNAFIAVVVGEVRDKKGYYRNFIGDTIKAVESTGAHYYNECILITQGSTIALRAGKLFETSRKLSNTHQKALIFLKDAKSEEKFKAWIDEFDKTREITEMHQNILIFLRGNSKLAKKDLGDCEYDIF